MYSPEEKKSFEIRDSYLLRCEFLRSFHLRIEEQWTLVISYVKWAAKSNAVLIFEKSQNQNRALEQHMEFSIFSCHFPHLSLMFYP